MQIHRLSLKEACVDPRWLQGARRGRVLVQDASVTLEGVRLFFQAEALPDGALAEVWCTAAGYYVCALAEDYDREEAETRGRVEAERQARLLREQQLKSESLAFNQALRIPVNWVPGHKDVLSGLAEHSHGDGLNARSVVHVLLQAPLADGRFKRSAGDLLCTSAGADNGRQWSSQRQAPSTARVTCKACLKLAARWGRSNKP